MLVDTNSHAYPHQLSCSSTPQDLRDRTYYLSNGVIRVGGRRVATAAANFTKGDIVGVVLDADQVCLLACDYQLLSSKPA